MCEQEPTVGALIDAARAAERRGAWDEALATYEAARARAADEDDHAATAGILRWIGTVHRERGDLELAMDFYHRSLEIAEANDLRDHIAAGLNCQGAVTQILGRLNEAEAFFTEAGRIADALGDAHLAAMVDQNLAALTNIRGDVEAALRHYRSARESFRTLGNDLAAAWVLHNMGMAHVDLAEWAAAEACFDEAFQLADRMQDATLLGWIELNRAELYLKRGDFTRAREYCDYAYEVFTRLALEGGLAEANKLYGVLFRDTVKPGLADVHFSRALELARDSGRRLLQAETHHEWALLHWEQGRSKEALQSLNAAHEIFLELGARRELLDLDRRLDQIEGIYLRIMRAWGESIESKDRYTAGHCVRVADYACMLAEAVGIEDRDLTWFRMGAFLHDVGKTAVPEEILNKPGKLTADEWALMQAHTTAGDEIVSELNFPWDVRAMVRSHHEHWAGTGYPDGLSGEQIPLSARILCVADVYDALTTTRSYRPALSQAEALRIMQADSGRIFDPELFPVFRSLLDAAPTPVLHSTI